MCAVCVLISSLGVPDGYRNHYTSLHHRNMSAMSAEGSRSGRQKKISKKEKERRSCLRNRKEAGSGQIRENKCEKEGRIRAQRKTFKKKREKK